MIKVRVNRGLTEVGPQGRKRTYRQSMCKTVPNPSVKPFLITTWYRPPNDPIETLHRFENCLQLIDSDNKESITLGDVNYDFLSENLSYQASELKFITRLYQYDQLIKPTYKSY